MLQKKTFEDFWFIEDEFTNKIEAHTDKLLDEFMPDDENVYFEINKGNRRKKDND